MLFHLLTSSQQEITNKEKKQATSNSDDDYDKKKMETKLSTIEEQEGTDRGKLRRGSLLPTYQDFSNEYDNNSVQKEEKIAIDYMAKDYASFRNALLDLIPRKIPQWKDRSEADMGIMLIELFSYVADELSYLQDRVANEAFLRTARARSSVSNHLRLIDYYLQNGVSANAFIRVEVKRPAVIPVGFQISTFPEKGKEGAAVIIFETLEERRVDVAYNEVIVNKINNNNSSPGNTTLSALLEGRLAGLKKRQYVMLFQKEVFQGDDHHPSRSIITRQSIVKLAEDSKIITDASGGENTIITWEKGNEYPESPHRWKGSIFCCANMLRASHGRTIGSEVLKHKNQEVSKFSFALKEGPLTFISDDAVSSIGGRSTLKVWVDGQQWEETDSLLKCGPFDHKFSLSIDEVGYVTVFFGNGKYGLKPEEDSLIEAKYRVGSGSVGNVGRGTLTHYKLRQNSRWLSEEVIESVTNPLAATGGIDTESMDDARIAGPKSLKTLERAVTLRDFEDLVKREFKNEITNARARFVYTGSWDTIFVSIDVKGGRKSVVDGDDDYGLWDKIRSYLDRVKMIGYEVHLEKAKYVPIKIEIIVCLEKNLDSETVRSRILHSLTNKDNTADGTKGLFHADNFTFGDPVYASKIYEVLKNTPEVKYGVITTFRKRNSGETLNVRHRLESSVADSSVPSSFTSFSCAHCSEGSIADRDEETKRNLELGYIPINENEIMTIDTDPSHPENGILILNFVKGDETKNDDSYSLSDDDNSAW